jgi:hypothetical protein
VKAKKLMNPPDVLVSQAEVRRYYENRIRELREQDPVANEEEIESLVMLLKISE